jgi:PAS domain S-box-containing protein
MPTILEENRRTVKKEKRSLLPELRELSKHMEELESDMSAFWKMNPALLMLIREGLISRINPAWEKYLGYAQEDIIGSNLYKLINTEDRDNLLEVMLKLKTESKPQLVIVRFKHCKKDEWTFIKMSLSYDPSSDSVFCTCWPLLSKCNDCPFLS